MEILSTALALFETYRPKIQAVAQRDPRVAVGLLALQLVLAALDRDDETPDGPQAG